MPNSSNFLDPSGNVSDKTYTADDEQKGVANSSDHAEDDARNNDKEHERSHHIHDENSEDDWERVGDVTLVPSVLPHHDVVVAWWLDSY